MVVLSRLIKGEIQMFRDLTRIAIHETGEKKSFVLKEKKANRKQKICVQHCISTKRLMMLAASSVRFFGKAYILDTYQTER